MRKMKAKGRKEKKGEKIEKLMEMNARGKKMEEEGRRKEER